MPSKKWVELIKPSIDPNAPTKRWQSVPMLVRMLNLAASAAIIVAGFTGPFGIAIAILSAAGFAAVYSIWAKYWQSHANPKTGEITEYSEASLQASEDHRVDKNPDRVHENINVRFKTRWGDLSLNRGFTWDIALFLGVMAGAALGAISGSLLTVSIAALIGGTFALCHIAYVKTKEIQTKLLTQHEDGSTDIPSMEDATDKPSDLPWYLRIFLAVMGGAGVASRTGMKPSEYPVGTVIPAGHPVQNINVIGILINLGVAYFSFILGHLVDTKRFSQWRSKLAVMLQLEIKEVPASASPEDKEEYENKRKILESRKRNPRWWREGDAIPLIGRIFAALVITGCLLFLFPSIGISFPVLALLVGIPTVTYPFIFAFSRYPAQTKTEWLKKVLIPLFLSAALVLPLFPVLGLMTAVYMTLALGLAPILHSTLDRFLNSFYSYHIDRTQPGVAPYQIKYSLVDQETTANRNYFSKHTQLQSATNWPLPLRVLTGLVGAIILVPALGFILPGLPVLTIVLVMVGFATVQPVLEVGAHILARQNWVVRVTFGLFAGAVLGTAIMLALPGIGVAFLPHVLLGSAFVGSAGAYLLPKIDHATPASERLVKGAMLGAILGVAIGVLAKGTGLLVVIAGPLPVLPVAAIGFITAVSTLIGAGAFLVWPYITAPITRVLSGIFGNSEWPTGKQTRISKANPPAHKQPSQITIDPQASTAISSSLVVPGAGDEKRGGAKKASRTVTFGGSTVNVVDMSPVTSPNSSFVSVTSTTSSSPTSPTATAIGGSTVNALGAPHSSTFVSVAPTTSPAAPLALTTATGSASGFGSSDSLAEFQSVESVDNSLGTKGAAAPVSAVPPLPPFSPVGTVTPTQRNAGLLSQLGLNSSSSNNSSATSSIPPATPLAQDTLLDAAAGQHISSTPPAI